MRPWYERATRWSQTNLTEDDLKRSDLSFWQDYWRDMDIHGVIINCGGIVSYYRSDLADLYRPPQLGEEDLYQRYSDAARELGLAVVARMDINSVHEAFYRRHPDWFCRDRQGQPIMTQGRYIACVNGGYFREHIPAVLQEVIAKYQPEGFADNSWAGLGRDQICHCDHCREGFQKDYGKKLPQEASWNDPAYADWIRWNYQCRIDRWQLFNDVTRRHGGDHCRWIGMVHANPFHAGDRFVDLRRLLAMTPLIFCDHQCRDELNGFEQNAVNGDLLISTAQERAPVTQSMAHYFRGIRTFRLTAATPGETRLWMLSGFAGGILPWVHYVGGNRDDRRKFQISEDLMKWHREQEVYLKQRKNLASVGIIWSQENIDFYGRDQVVERCEYPWRGFIHALSQKGVPIRPIHADDIMRYADTLEVLILPDVAILTPDQQKQVLMWLERGKHLVLSQQTGRRSETGEHCQDSPLWQALKLSARDQFWGPEDQSSGDWARHEAHSYLNLPETKRHPILAGFSDTDILPFGGRIFATASQGPLEPVCGYIPPFPIYPPEFSWIRERRDDIAPIFAGTLQSGSRVVYLAADLDRCYGKHQTPDLGRLLFNAVRWASEDRLPCQIEAPAQVHAALFSQGDHKLLHLLNLAGANGPLGTCEKPLPIGPVTVCLRKDLFLQQKVTCLVDKDRKITVASDSNQLRLTLSELKEHELLLLR